MSSRLVSVPLSAPYADHKYVFRTTIESAKSTTLGHTAVTAETAVAGLIFEANYPKPARASKAFASGSTQSFVAPASIAAARTAGWSVSRTKSNGKKNNSRFTVVVYVTVNSVKYAWAIPKKSWAKLKNSAKALGIKEAQASDNDLVFGATFPKPPKATVTTTSADGVTKNTSFVDPSNLGSLPTGTNVSGGRYLALDWASIA